MDLIKRAGTALLLACAGTVTAGPSAHAAVTIGQVAPSNGVLATCDTGATDLLQPSVTAGGNLYSTRAGGTITSWSIRTAGPIPGDSYTLKVFRRTTDPDIFRVMGHAGPQSPASVGVHTFPAQLAVSSGDLIGLNASGAGNECRFDSPGDLVLRDAGNLPDGGVGNFPPGDAFADSRLNLSATLIPTNSFSFGRVSRDRSKGTARVEVLVSNPGSVTVTGKGLKAKRPTKATFVAGPINFSVAAIGKKRRKLGRRGKVSVGLTATFTPTGGDAAAQTLGFRLKKKK